MNVRKTSLALALAGGLSVLAACGGSSGDAADSDKKVIGVMTLVQSNEAITKTLAGIQRQAKEEGYEVKVIDANFDTQKQATAIQTFINQKVDGIVNIAGDNSVMASAFRKSEAAEIPVISLNGGDAVEGVTVNAPMPETELAAESAEYFFDRLSKMDLPAKATIIEQVLPDATPCRMREEGFDSVTKQHPDVKVVKYAIDAQNPASDAFTYTSQYLASHPEVVGVLSCWDDPALAAVKASEKAGKTPDDFVVVGYNGQSNALDELRKDKTVFAATAGFGTGIGGKEAVDTLSKIFDGEKVPDTLESATAVIDASNVPPAGESELAEWIPEGWPTDYWKN